MTTHIPVKRALLSVSNKEGIVDFAKRLVELDVELISTGGTSKALREANIPHRQVDELTQLPEMLDGRVKTLHPKVHGGILGRRDVHAKEAEKHAIDWIDLVVVNFYPFATAIKNKSLTWQEAVEYIDIGGPTMVRAAAKNFAWVSVIVDPTDYGQIIEQLKTQQGIDFDSRKKLAEKAFNFTSHYDAMISNYFLEQHHDTANFPHYLNLPVEKITELRYGENPHQKASAYQLGNKKTGILASIQYQGKPLSYNNILDTEAAFACVKEFVTPACVVVKHANPCGVASAADIFTAYHEAYETDALSAFGGVIALNRACTKEIAESIATKFIEVIIAPDFTEESLAILAVKQNLRVLKLAIEEREPWEIKFIHGAVLLQERDQQAIKVDDLKIVTQIIPTEIDMKNMLFAWQVIKHIKSNGILIAKNNVTLGIGAGQVSRVDAVEIALRKAEDKMQDAILASDAFFPFRDSIDRLAQTGIRAIIQPGGSIRDEEVIQACNEHGIAMVFTGLRCFRH